MRDGKMYGRFLVFLFFYAFLLFSSFLKKTYLPLKLVSELSSFPQLASAFWSPPFHKSFYALSPLFSFFSEPVRFLGPAGSTRSLLPHPVAGKDRFLNV